MHFVRLTSLADPRADAVLAFYDEAFPFHEQRERASQQRIMTDPAYHFSLIEDEGQTLGLMLYWETDRFLYVEHFCVSAALRGHGCGSRALACLATQGKTVILEIDPPIDDIAKRRQAFYERNGYRSNAFAHVHPPYHRGLCGHDLTVMSLGRTLSPDDYEDFRRFLETRVMHDAF